MSIIADFADLYSSSADGVSSAMDDWLAMRPTDPKLVPLWNLQFTRLGNSAAALRSVAAHLYNLDAQAAIASVGSELTNIRQATFQVHSDIAQLRKIDDILQVLAGFVGLGISIAAFVAVPNPASAAALPGQIQNLLSAIHKYRAAEAAARAVAPSAEV